MSCEADDTGELKRLKNRRRSFKGSITTRIDTLKRLLSEGGSRSKITFLLQKLNETFSEVSVIANEIHDTTQDYADQEWLSIEQIRVDDVSAEVHEYLEARKDDAPSEDSLTESWINKHSIRYEPSFSESDSGADKLANQMASTELEDMRQKGAILRTHQPVHDGEQHGANGLFGGYFGGGSVNVSSYPSILQETTGTSSGQTRVQFEIPPRFQPPIHGTHDILAFPLRPSLLQGTMDARSSIFQPNSVTDSNGYSGSNALYQSCHSAISSGAAGGLGISSDVHGS